MSAETWTFDGVTFERIISGDTIEPWFSEVLNYTKDTVLGATTAAQSYIDQGAVEVPPFEIRASFSSESARDAFLAKRYLTKTLSNTNGYSGTALLAKAKRANGGGTFYFVDCVFELR